MSACWTVRCSGKKSSRWTLIEARSNGTTTAVGQCGESKRFNDYRLPRLPHTNRVALRLVVHRNELHLFRGVLGQDDRLKRSLVARGHAVHVFEDTIGLRFDAAVFAVAQLHDDFEPSVIERAR